MDFNQFDTRSTSDEGRDLHLKHPVSGELLYDGDLPCIAVVLGSEGRKVQEKMADLRRAKVIDDTPFDKLTRYERHERAAVVAKHLVAGFKNISRGEKSATAPDDVEWLLDLQVADESARNEASFAEQITDFSTRRANFLGASSKG